MKLIDAIEDFRKRRDAGTSKRKVFVSFEFYPPKTDTGMEKLDARMDRYKAQEPLYVDFTWGAGGSTAEKTAKLAANAQAKGFEVNMHLTCTNMTVDKVITGLSEAKKAGVQNICALRGDPPEGQERWVAQDVTLTCARDLIQFIKKKHGDHFGISVAGYPEGHPSQIKEVSSLNRELTESEKARVSLVDIDGTLTQFVCPDAAYAAEIAYLKSKIDAGGQVIITQLFYDADVFLNFVKACREVGITCPIIPGIMPVQKYGLFKRMTGKSSPTRVPQAAFDKIEELKEDAQALAAFGLKFGTDMCKRLVEGGVEGVHFYTMNLEKLTLGIMEGLGLKFSLPKPSITEPSISG